MEAIALWVGFGFLSCLAAVFMFRRDGRAVRKWELYFAVIGPLFGPVVLILAAWDRLSQWLNEYV